MEILIKEHDGQPVCQVRMPAHLDFNVARDCLHQLRGIDLNRLVRLEFDLVRTIRLESAGLGMLMHAHDRWGRQHQPAAIRCVRGTVHEMLIICRMQRYFRIELLA